jgi:hypothetical protein
VAPAAEPDQVWVWNDGPAAPTVTRMSLDGQPVAGPVTMPAYSTVLGADGPGAVALAGPDGFYRAVVDGTTVSVERTSPRVPLTYSDSSLLELACSSTLDCHVELIDRASGAARPVAVPPPDFFFASFSPYDSALSPDGKWLARIERGGENGRLLVYHVDSGEVALRAEITPNFGVLHQLPFGFSADGRWLVYVDGDSDINVWSVGSADAPLIVELPGLQSINSVSVAP